MARPTGRPSGGRHEEGGAGPQEAQGNTWQLAGNGKENRARVGERTEETQALTPLSSLRWLDGHGPWPTALPPSPSLPATVVLLPSTR